jgi:hypothetical protein
MDTRAIFHFTHCNFLRLWLFISIDNNIENREHIEIVSPELHKKPYAHRWPDFKSLLRSLKETTVELCTDFPREAEEFL